MAIDIFIIGLLVGSVSGLLAGLFGIGGGLVIVPILVMVFKHWNFSMEARALMAVATSLATIMLTSLSSVIAHQRLGSVVWSKVGRLAPGIVVGAALGAVIAEGIPGVALHFILAGFLIYVGCQMALDKAPGPGNSVQRRWQDYTVALLIGLLSVIVGIGGGTLTVPYLLRGPMPMPKAVGVSSACGLPTAVVGTISYALLGWKSADLPGLSLGYVYLPAFGGIALSSIVTAPLGALLSHKLPAKKLKRYFSLLLFIMAAKLLWP